MAQCVISQYNEQCCPLKTGNTHCTNGVNTQGKSDFLNKILLIIFIKPSKKHQIKSPTKLFKINGHFFQPKNLCKKMFLQ